MRRSEYPTEIELGIEYYASNAEGIGGRLKSSPEDFYVEEMPIKFTNTGPFLICRLTKKSWEHQHAMREITNRLKISPKRIGWAGTKDRNAVTVQYVSLYNVKSEDVNALEIKDMELVPVGTHQFSLGLGNLEGNKFRVVIRGCSSKDLENNVCEITESIKSGIPNYFGIQRFGAMKPVTHKMGYHILRGEYEDAVKLYVGDCFPYESDEIKEARRNFAESLDAKRALYELPVHLNYERIMLDSLMKSKDDYAAALQALPPKLLSMFVSAYQSWLFNLSVSMRCGDDVSFDEPRVGEHLVFMNGRIDTVTERNINTARQHMRRGRCFITGWMPGKSLPVSCGPLEDVMFSQMEKDDISMESFDRAAAFVKTNFDGSNRRISVNADVSYEITGDDVILEFCLPSGHYATTVAREYMKAEPSRMV